MKILQQVSFYIFLLVLVQGCFNPDISVTVPTDNTNYKEQQFVAFTSNSTAGGNYQAPAFVLGEELKKVKKTLQALKLYSVAKGYSNQYAFIVDMRIPCYKKRFFVYDLLKDSLLKTGLVAHGIGSETFKGNLIFSNIPDSRQSSLGRYKIGTSYNGMWGFSYKLHGLDSTNSKAFERAVVLHSHQIIKDEEIDDNPIGFSYGCPMVSANFLNTLKSYIGKSKKPIVLQIIY